jgi:hypothetical protein
MRQVIWGLTVLLMVGLPVLAAAPRPAEAAPGCACLDNNDNNVCDGGDTILDDNDWLKGPGVGLGGNFIGSNFLIPAGCSIVVTSAPSGGIRVTADKVSIKGSLNSTPTGGEGVLFTSLGDIFVEQVAAGSRPHVESGGINKLANVLANAAVAKSSVAFKAAGACTFLNADLIGRPIHGSGQVGIQCQGDLDIHGSTILAAGVDIQSLTGVIDATATAGAVPVIGIECDDPTKNLTGNGNNNGVVDGPDFPCQLAFNNQGDIINVCVPEPPVTPNDIRALNNPLVMIAEGDLKLDSPTFPGNVLEGRFRIKLVSVTGTLDTDNATISNHLSGTPLGGATISLVADPTVVNRAPVLKEKTFGPNGGNIEIDGACIGVAGRPVFFSLGSALVGTPAPPPCAQLPDFVPVLNDP